MVLVKFSLGFIIFSFSQHSNLFPLKELFVFSYIEGQREHQFEQNIDVFQWCLIEPFREVPVELQVFLYACMQPLTFIDHHFPIHVIGDYVDVVS